MFCTNCGAKISDDSMFCEECGARIDDEPVQMEPESRIPTGGNNSSSIKYIVVAVAVIALIGIAILVVWSRKHDGDEGVTFTENTSYDELDTEMEEETSEVEDDLIKTDEAKEDTTDIASVEEAVIAEENNTDADDSKVPDKIGTEDVITAPTESVRLETFDWYYNEGFPTDGRPLITLKEICGKWNCMMTVTSEVSEGEQTRILLTEAEVTASDDTVKLLMHLKEKIDYMTSSPNDKNFEKPEQDVLMTYNGSWDELMGYINTSSQNSDLGIQLKDFVEVSGKQYAIGVLYNGDIDVGEVLMVR